MFTVLKKVKIPVYYKVVHVYDEQFLGEWTTTREVNEGIEPRKLITTLPFLSYHPP